MSFLGMSCGGLQNLLLGFPARLEVTARHQITALQDLRHLSLPPELSIEAYHRIGFRLRIFERTQAGAQFICT